MPCFIFMSISPAFSVTPRQLRGKNSRKRIKCFLRSFLWFFFFFSEQTWEFSISSNCFYWIRCLLSSVCEIQRFFIRSNVYFLLFMIFNVCLSSWCLLFFYMIMPLLLLLLFLRDVMFTFFSFYGIRRFFLYHLFVFLFMRSNVYGLCVEPMRHFLFWRQAASLHGIRTNLLLFITYKDCHFKPFDHRAPATKMKFNPATELHWQTHTAFLTHTCSTLS